MIPLKQDFDFARYLLVDRHDEFVPRFNSQVARENTAYSIRCLIREFQREGVRWARGGDTYSRNLESEAVLMCIYELLGHPENMGYLKLSKTPSGFNDPKDYKDPANWPAPVACVVKNDSYLPSGTKEQNEEALYNRIVNDKILLRDLPKNVKNLMPAFEYIIGRVTGFPWYEKNSPDFWRVVQQIINPTSSKETNIMAITTPKFFSTQVLVNGLNIESMSNTDIYNAISRQSDKIKNLEEIQTQPLMLKNEIKAEKESLDSLIKYLDEKSATTATPAASASA